MTEPKKIALAKGERIIAVVPQYAAGPGWSNAPTWVHIVDREGRWREECIQPEERSTELHALFAVGAVVHGKLIDAVPVRKERKP